MLPIHPKQRASMLTRDGVRLDADIYYPHAQGDFPVLLMRQPYSRAIASTVVYAHPIWYAAHGYIVVIQDVRGRGTSAGEFKLFAHEIEDGFDSINWAANLPGSNGKVGMYGFSYQGMTQLYAASAHPQALKTICPAMVGYDLYTDWAYEGGAFCLQANLGWAIQLATETARLREDESTYLALFNASRNLPLNNSIPANPDILKTLAPESFYHEWLKHDQPGEYWQKLSPDLSDVDLPMLHIGGWFDCYLRGTLHLYKEMAARSNYRQQLLVGAWGHLPWSHKVGEIDYGGEAQNLVDKLQIRWFNQFLKDIDTGLLDESPVSLFEMGSNQWRDYDVFPSNNQQSFYLSSQGLASSRNDDGILFPIPYSPLLIPHSYDIIVHDPWRAIPSLGGHAGFSVGQCDRTMIDCRTDVLKYTSPILKEDLYITGDVAVELFCSAEQPSFDLCAILSEVKIDGSVYNFTQGYRRVNPDDFTNPLRISLQSTCIKISKGNALRLSLSAACYPAFPVNSGTGLSVEKARLMDNQVITLKVHCGDDFLSQVLLPIISNVSP